jgi:hypothetical protein
MFVMLRELPPTFVSVTACAALVVDTVWEEKVKLVGENVADGDTVMPVPVRATVCALYTALSENVRSAVSFAATVGVNVTLTEQLAFGATVTSLQAFALIAKSATFCPESVTPLEPKIKLESPLFVIIKACGGLEVLIIWLANVRLDAESVTAGADALGLISNTVPSCRLDPPSVVVL